MRLARGLREVQWNLRRQWFGVWEVRNYYTTLEERAFAGAEVTLGYVLMVVVAALLATSGLLLDSPTVVMGGGSHSILKERIAFKVSGPCS